jgi:hypothetical protein
VKKRLCALWIAGLSVAVPAWAQQVEGPKFIAAQSSGVTDCVTTGVATTNCVIFDIPNNPSVTLGVTQGFTGTLEIETSVDGVTWASYQGQALADGTGVTQITSAGQFSVANTGLVRVRLRASAFTPGTTARVTLTRGSGRPNALGGTPGAGDIESVTAGSGLTGGGTVGPVTLNVGAGPGITVNANDVQVATAGVTLAMLADLAQDQFIVRTTASTGVPETATVTAAARTVLDDTTVVAMVDTLGGASSLGTGGLVRGTNPTIVSPIFSTYMDWPEATAFPGSPVSGWTLIITDDSAAGACDSGAGAVRTLCTYNGSAWVALGGAAGGATLWNNIGDATADGLIDLLTMATQWTSSRSSAGTVFDLLNSTADLTANVVLETKRFTDTADANGFYAQYIADAAGTPVTQFQFGMTASILGTTGMTVAGGGTWTFSGANAYGTPTSITLTNASSLPLSGLATQAADTVVANITGGAAAPTAVTYATLASEMGIIDSAAAPGADALAFYDFSATQTDWMTIPAGFATWFGAPSCTNWSAVVTGETGTGACVFGTSPAITTSITTPSATFALFNTTATTVNAFGETATLNLGASVAMVLNIGGFTSAAEVRLLEPSGGGTSYTAVKVGAQAASITYVLPPTVGGANTYLKDVIGDGVLSWSTVAGGGDVSKVGTPANNQMAVWTGDGTLEGTSDFTYDGTNLNLITAKNFQIAGVTVLSDAAGTTTLDAIDTLGATTEATVEAAIDTLANLTSIQGQTFTLSAGAFIRSGAHSFTMTSTGATNVTFPTTGTLGTLTGTEILIGKTINAEDTGNVITIPIVAIFTPASAQNGTASLGFNTTTSGAATATFSGTTVVVPLVNFADSGTQEVQFSVPLPPDIDLALAVEFLIKWRTPATTGNVLWKVQGICAGNSAQIPTAYSTSVSSVTDAADGTTNDLNDATLTVEATADKPLVTCTAGQQWWVRLYHEPGDGADTINDAAQIVGLMWRYRGIK